PPGNEVYLRKNGDDQVLVTAAALCDAIPKTADDLRSRKLLHGHRAAVRTVELRSPDRPFITLSRDSGTWRMVQPAAAPASDDTVDALLDALYDARLSRFVWPTVSNVMHVAEADAAVQARAALYGLTPDTGLQLSVQETGDAPPEKLTFGRPLENAAALSYVLLPGAGAIGAVSNTLAEALRQLSPAALRDPRPFSGSPAGVRRLQVQLEDVQFVLTQTNAAWRVEAPVADDADPAAVRDTLERLLRLQAEPPGGDDGRRGNDLEPNHPVSRVELVSDQGTWRFTLEHDDIGGQFMGLAFTNAPAVLRVATSNVPPALLRLGSLLELRGKTMLALPRATLRRIAVKRGGAPAATVERERGDAPWRLGEGSAGRISDGRLAALTARLEDLRAERIEAAGLTPERLAEAGLRVPWLEVSVDVEARDAVRKALLVGREASPGKRYAAVRGLDLLFVLDAETLAPLAEPFVEPIE
ncbi:MAG: DUF4340 domain-containing protein, partial [Verrucomicrobiota bacterium]|nr:DUF4340 domain-containing protein [Verrucomicrobiota bacterium]